VSKGLITPTRDGIRLNLKVSPGARRTSIAGTYGEDTIRLNVSAPPKEGRVNSEIEGFLSSLLGVPRSDVAVTRGASSRNKVVVVRGLQQTQTYHLLSPYRG
jgi:uncharacterized protein (TIGR00251 family)